MPEAILCWRRQSFRWWHRNSYIASASQSLTLIVDNPIIRMDGRASSRPTPWHSHVRGMGGWKHARPMPLLGETPATPTAETTVLPHQGRTTMRLVVFGSIK